MKNFFKKIFFLNKVIGFLIFNFGFLLLIYVFKNHLENTFIAYVSYILSFYALLNFSIWFYRICEFSKKIIKKSKMYSLYQKNFIIITKILLYLSFIFNLIYGVFKLGIGIYYKSWWFITFAIYYLLLCFMKLSLVKNINNEERKYQKLKDTGIILLFLNFILVGIMVLVIKQNQIVNYNGVLIYLVAINDFYLIIKAVINVFKYKKNHSPIILASKCLNLTVAMISMVSLEVAMIYQFGNNDFNFKLIMTISMVFVICLINSFMAIYMVVKANDKLKK